MQLPNSGPGPGNLANTLLASIRGWLSLSSTNENLEGLCCLCRLPPIAFELSPQAECMSLSPAIIGAAIPVAASAARGAAKLIGEASAAFSQVLSDGGSAAQETASSLNGLLDGIRDELQRLSGGQAFELEVDLSQAQPRLSFAGPGAEQVQQTLASAPELVQRLVNVAQRAVSAYSANLGTNAVTFYDHGWSLNTSKDAHNL